MSFLTLNGIAWEIANESVGLKINEIGWTGRAIDGTEVGTRRALKREWTLKSLPLSPTDSQALQAAVLGLGHHWSFDNNSPAGSYLYSDKGLPNDAISGAATYTTSTPTPKFGAGCLKISSNGAVTFPAVVGVDGATSPSWSYIVWFWNGSSWDCYAGSHQGSTNLYYLNGTLNVGTPGFLAVSGNGFQLLGKDPSGSNQISYFDDLVVFPFVARPADLATWSQETSAFAPLSKLAIGGSILNAQMLSAPSLVYGTIDDVKPMIVNLGDGSGLYQGDANQISFSLREP